MAYYLQFDGTNDHVTLDSSIDFLLEPNWEVKAKIKLDAIRDNTVWLFGLPIYIHPSNAEVRIRYSPEIRTGANLTRGQILELRVLKTSPTLHEVFVNESPIATITTDTTGYTDNGLFSQIAGIFNQYSAFDLYSMSVEVGGVLLHNYDPSATGGTGLVLKDVEGGNDGTLVNFPTDNSQWVFYGAAGGVTLDGAFALPLLTALGDASATQPQPNIAGAFNLPALTVQSNGSASLPQPSISGAFSLPLLTVTANSSATLPQPIVNGSFNLPLVDVNGSVTASLPQPNITGAFSLPLLTASGTASATTTIPEITGAFNLPTLTISGSASASLPQPNIIGAFSLPMLTVQGTGSALVPQPIINGNITLPKLTISGSGSVTLPQPIANGAFNLPLLNVLGFATVSGLEIIIDKQANINQKFLSANVNQEFLSANIKQRYLSNNITYN